MADLETLTLRITEESSKAFSAIDKLAKRLDGLSVAVAKLEVGKLNDLARGLVNLNSAIVLVKDATSQADYTRIFKQLSTLGNVDTSKMNDLSASLGTLSTALQNIPTTVGSTTGIKDLIASIGKLGGVNIQRAITNIPQLESALGKLIKRFSTLPKINQSVIDFTNALANLAQQGQRTGSAAHTISASLESYSSTVSRATKRTHSLASTIGTLYAKFWLLLRGARGLKNAFMDAADYLEAYNYFDVTAKKIGKDTFTKAGIGSAEQYAEAFTQTLQEKLHKMSGLELDLEQRLIKTTNAKSLGLNLTELTQYQASIASITNAMGVSQEIAQSTAKAFSMLAGDMGSLKNLDFEQVSQNLQSALTGQARALYKYGIDLTTATLQQYAYAEAIDKSVSEMTQAEKAQLRLLAILDQSKVSWGDLANTINSPSNQLRMLKNNLKEVGTVMGQLFIPIMQSVLPVLNGLSMAIKQLMVDIAELLGIKLDLESFGTFGDEVEADVDAVEDLNKAMKETKKSIREFDELKVINNSKDKGSGLGNEIDLTKQIIEATAEYEKVWDEAYRRMTSKAQEIAGYISAAFEPIKKIIQDFHVGDFFKAGEDVSALVASIFNFISEAINSVNWTELGNKIGEFIKGINWTEILKGIGNIIGSALQAALNLWQGMYDVAPFETALLTGFAVLKFTGFGDIIKTGLGKALSKQLKAQGLSKEFSAALGKLGLISVGIGIALTIDNVKSVKNGEYSAFSLKSLLKQMISSLFTGAGIALLASSIGIASGGFAFGIGAAVALLVNLAVTGASMDTPYEAAKKVIDEEYKWVTDNDLDRMEILTNIELKQGEIDTQFLQIDDLADKVYELSLNYDKLTDGEKGLLKYYSDELIKVMPELANQVDKVTGAYKGTREELDKLIESQKRQMMLEAYKDNMSELLQGISSAERDIDKLWEKQSENVNKIFDVKDKFRKYMGDDFSEELWNYVVQSNKKENEGKILDYLAPDVSEYTKSKALRAVWDDVDDLGDLIGALAEADVIKEGLSTTSSTLQELEKEYGYYEEKVAGILGEDIPKVIKDGNEEAANIQNKSKLPKAVETTMDKVDDKIKNGEKITKTDMNNMFNGINNSFAGLGNGKVPREVQNTMNAIENAILTNSPKLVEYMKKLRLQMEEAFINTSYDKEGNQIYNLNNITGRMDDTFASLNQASAAKVDMRGMEKPLEDELHELFGDKLPKSVEKDFDTLKDAIKKGYGVGDAISDLQSSIKDEAKKLGMNVAFGYTGGIYDGQKVVKKAVQTTIVDTSTDTAMEGLDENSPSKVFRTIGEYVPEGMALGIEDGIPKLKLAVNQMTEAMKSAFGDYRYNIPKVDFGGSVGSKRYDYGNMDMNNAFMSQMSNMASQMAQSGQTEVIFRVEGDPHGMFKVIREENDRYKNRTHKSAFI